MIRAILLTLALVLVLAFTAGIAAGRASALSGTRCTTPDGRHGHLVVFAVRGTRDTLRHGYRRCVPDGFSHTFAR